jgi:hypothetical protein
MPDLLIFEYEEKTGSSCSGTPDVTIKTGPITGGDPAYDISTSAVVLNPTTNRVIVDTSRATLDRFLFTVTADDGACAAGDLDVRMMFVNRKNRP